MSKALYRNYRSKSLSELVGQEPVTQALTNSLKSGKISHAYLFTGPRGVGKTSVARILAHEINSLEYHADSLPLDIIEIDAASNRRIDEIRDLRDKVHIAPTSAKYKVYIIDEVHMLTREAFNALLKTLEEPPNHVVFILATTEAHKVPETIVSRTQRYNFKLISTSDIQKHLKTISVKEKINITDDALELIAKHSGGSLRDALSLLDQVRHTPSKIDAATVESNIGLPATQQIENILEAVAAGNASEILKNLKEAQNSGASSSLMAQSLITEIKNQLSSNKPLLELGSSLKLLQQLLNVESSSQPETMLEVALLGTVIDSKKPAAALKPTTTGPPLTLSKPVAQAKRDIAEREQKAKQAKKDRFKVKTTQANLDMSLEVWTEALESISASHNTLFSVLKTAKAEIPDKQTLLLKFSYPFHQKRINEARNKKIVQATLASLGAENTEILCELMSQAAIDPVTEVTLEPLTKEDIPKRDEAWLDQIKTVFGGAEVLE